MRRGGFIKIRHTRYSDSQQSNKFVNVLVTAKFCDRQGVPLVWGDMLANFT